MLFTNTRIAHDTRGVGIAHAPGGRVVGDPGRKRPGKRVWMRIRFQTAFLNHTPSRGSRPDRGVGGHARPVGAVRA